MTNVSINSERLNRELHYLATLTDCPAADASLPVPSTAVTRVIFTPRDLAAREWLRELAWEAGFFVREDAVGNMFIRWPGSDPDLPAVGTGSHTDAIPHSGMYDGTVGVLGGLEAMRSLAESGFVPRRPIETLMLTSEEPTRFGIGCLGSRLLGGVLSAEVADALKDRLYESDATAAPGMTLKQVRNAAGFVGSLADIKLPDDHFHAWVELHIEQGPLLERDGIDLGIVTNIAAPASYRYTVEGFGGHAGALLMPDRRDAMCAAAEVILCIEKLALEANARSQGVDTVATVGSVIVHPGNVNSVPSRVQFMLDIRDTDVARRDGIMAALHAFLAEIEAKRGVKISEELINADAPAVSSPEIVATLEEACREEGATYRKLVSRAYHDSTFMAQVCPIAMLFIPCRAGVSHRPDEYSTEEAIALGTRVLAGALARLSC